MLVPIGRWRFTLLVWECGVTLSKLHVISHDTHGQSHAPATNGHQYADSFPVQDMGTFIRGRDTKREKRRLDSDTLIVEWADDWSGVAGER